MEMFYFKFYKLGSFVSTVIFILVCCLSFIFNSTFLLISFVLGFEEENGEKSSHVTGTQLRVWYDWLIPDFNSNTFFYILTIIFKSQLQ